MPVAENLVESICLTKDDRACVFPYEEKTERNSKRISVCTDIQGDGIMLCPTNMETVKALDMEHWSIRIPSLANNISNVWGECQSYCPKNGGLKTKEERVTLIALIITLLNAHKNIFLK